MPLGIYTVLRFSVELLAAESLFVVKLPRRRYWVLPLLPLIALSLIVNYLLARYGRTYILAVCRYLIIFGISVLIALSCFRIDLKTAAACANASYATQFMASKFFGLIEALTEDILPTFWVIVLYVLTYALIYAVSYLLFGRRVTPDLAGIRRTDILLISSFTVVCMILLSTMYSFMVEQVITETIWLAASVSGYSVLASLLILFLQFDMSEKSALEREKQEQEQIRYFEKKQMNLSKETVDYINIKCHDLKKMVNSYGGALTAGEMEELKNKLDIYDSSVRTGNDMLDLVIAQKAPECEKHSMQLNIIADGSALSFLTDAEVYSLFANLLDNAAEAVVKLPDPDDRVIDLSVKTRMDMVSIHTQNRYIGDSVSDGSLPATSKDDKIYHGYGMKSIRAIIQKYDGTLTVNADGRTFTVDAIIPVQEREEKTSD